MIHKLTDPEKAASLFAGWEETVIWSCLQEIMGEIYADEIQNPQSAAAVLGDFIFLAGNPSEEFACFQPCEKESWLLVPQNKEWEEIIEKCRQGKVKKFTRYAVKKETDVWDEAYLRKITEQLPEGYELRLIDEELYKACLKEEWSRDLTAQFDTYESYKKWGVGVAVIYEGELVSGASSYSRYRDGIEIEIDTKEEYRRKGLARTCGAALILECLKRNLYPSWDAHTQQSLDLAETLGYHRGEPYTAYLLERG